MFTGIYCSNKTGKYINTYFEGVCPITVQLLSIDIAIVKNNSRKCTALLLYIIQSPNCPQWEEKDKELKKH
jgi:hypothetical protein